MKASVSLCVVLALATPCAADVLHVPAQYATIQDAIDAARPDDQIVVHGGTYDPIVVDKPLTILGDPRPTIRYDEFSTVGQGPGPAPAAIRLAGPGSGRLLLSNLLLSQGFYGIIRTSTEPAIFGGGFSELQIHDSEVRALGFSVPEGDCCFRGVPALDTSVPQVLISNSTLVGSDSDTGVCGILPEPARPGIWAPSSTVTLLDSTVVGGGLNWVCGNGTCYTHAQLSPLLAPAITVRQLYLSTSSRVSGGDVNHNIVNTGSGYPSCGPGPTGPLFGSALPRFLPDDLQDFGELALGEVWTLYWETPGPYQVLYLTRRPRLPPVQTPRGLEFLDFSQPILPRVFAGSGPTAWWLRIPANPSLIGLPITAQVFDTQSGYTRPIVDMVGPGASFARGKLHGVSGQTF